MRIRESLTGTVLAGSVSLLLAASQFAPLIPGWEALPEIPGSHHLDYGPSHPGRFEPLSDAFIAKTLGIRRGKTLEAVFPPASVRARGTPPGAAASAPIRRTVVTHPLTNDDFEDAYPVESVPPPFTARTDASTASRQQGEPGSCAPAGPTIWYSYRATTDDGLIASTIGTKRPTSLAIFAGAPRDPFIGCASNPQGNAKTAFPVEAGRMYYFQVTTPTGGGPTEFHLDPLGHTERVSVSSRGKEGNYLSNPSGLSPNGRWVVFNSLASNLVDDDRNDRWDVFVHDRATADTTLVSVDSDGTQGDDDSGGGADTITPDGRLVAFYSEASLVDDDTNGWSDVFVLDRRTGKTERVSVSSTGAQGEAPVDPYVAANNLGDPYWLQGVSISADGRFVAFQSALSGLVPDDEEPAVRSKGFDGGLDVFLHDRRTKKTTMVSVSSDGEYANDWSEHPSMSADGRYIAFRSFADNLVPQDTNETADVFVHDRLTGRTERVSVDSKGRQAKGTSPFKKGNSQIPAISLTGRYVAFASWASNLVENDTNDTLDVFLHDRLTHQTTRVSLTSEGEQQEGPQDDLQEQDFGLPRVSVSADGRFVAFTSAASNLAPEHDDDVPLLNWQGVFVHDRLTGATIEASVSSRGRSGRAWSNWPILSADGRYVAFMSQDSGLVEGDNNGSAGPLIPNTEYFAVTRPWSGRGDDVFVHEFPVLR